MVFIILLVVAVIAGFYLYKNSRPKVVKSFPTEWESLLQEHVRFYRNLPTSGQSEFKRRILEFLSEVYIDGVQIEINDLDKLLIASSAVIPVFWF